MPLPPDQLRQILDNKKRGFVEAPDLGEFAPEDVAYFQGMLWEKAVDYMTDDRADLNQERLQELGGIYRLAGMVPGGREIVLSACLDRVGRSWGETGWKKGFSEILYFLDPNLEVTQKLIEAEKGEPVGMTVFAINSASMLLSWPDPVVSPEEKMVVFESIGRLYQAGPDDKQVKAAYLSALSLGFSDQSIKEHPRFQRLELLATAVSNHEANQQALDWILIVTTPEDLKTLAETRPETIGELAAYIDNLHTTPSKGKGCIERAAVILSKMPTGDLRLARAVLRATIRSQANYHTCSWQWEKENVDQTDFGPVYAALKRQVDGLESRKKGELAGAAELLQLADIHFRRRNSQEALAYKKTARGLVFEITRSSRQKRKAYEESMASDSEIVTYGMLELLTDSRPEFLAQVDEERETPRWISLMEKLNVDWHDSRVEMLGKVLVNVYRGDGDAFIRDFVIYGQEGWLAEVGFTNWEQHPAYFRAKEQKDEAKFSELKGQLERYRTRAEGGETTPLWEEMQRTLTDADMDRLVTLVPDSIGWREGARDWWRQYQFLVLSSSATALRVKKVVEVSGLKGYLNLDQAREILVNLRQDEELTIIESVFCRKAVEEHRPEMIVEAVNHNLLKDLSGAVIELLPLSPAERKPIERGIGTVILDWAASLDPSHLGIKDKEALRMLYANSFWRGRVRATIKRLREVRVDRLDEMFKRSQV